MNEINETDHNDELVPQVERQSYFLVHGEVTFRHDEESDPIGINVNCIAISVDGRCNVKDLLMIEKTLQRTLQTKLGEENPVEILDTTISNILHLGQFTPEEFSPAPKPISN